MEILTNIYKWMFSIPENHITTKDIVVWWELRRIPYNIIVGVLGGLSLILFFFFISHAGHLKPGEDAIEPMALIIAPFLINIGYTAGWFLEVILRKILKIENTGLGISILKFGILFSILVIFLPSIIWGIIFINNIH